MAGTGLLRAESVDESCSNPRQQGRTYDGCFGCTGRNSSHFKHGKLSVHTHTRSFTRAVLEFCIQEGW